MDENISGYLENNFKCWRILSTTKQFECYSNPYFSTHRVAALSYPVYSLLLMFFCFNFRSLSRLFLGHGLEVILELHRRGFKILSSLGSVGSTFPLPLYCATYEYSLIDSCMFSMLHCRSIAARRICPLNCVLPSKWMTVFP